NLADVLEQERHRSVGTEVAAVLGKRMADVGNGAGAVVGHAIDDHRGAADAVALVADLLVADVLEAAAAALHRAVDRVLRHVLRRGLVDREAQPRVHRRVTAAEARGDGDLLDEAREDLAALRIGGGFAMLDVGPFAVAGHGVECVTNERELYRPSEASRRRRRRVTSARRARSAPAGRGSCAAR